MTETSTLTLSDGTPVLISACDEERLLDLGPWHHVQGPKSKTSYAACWQKDEQGRRWFCYMHRLILDAPPHLEVDHKNGDGLFNTRENLRLCTPTQNRQNMTLTVRNTTGYKGVGWHLEMQKYAVQIRVDGESRFLGNFDDLQEAALTYDRVALTEFQDFACLNFPPHTTYSPLRFVPDPPHVFKRPIKKSRRTSEIKVLLIRRLWQKGDCTQKELGLKVGLSESAISRIVNGNRWQSLLNAA